MFIVIHFKGDWFNSLFATHPPTEERIRRLGGMCMKKLIQKLISTGADLSTKKALKNTMNFLGMDPKNIDKLYIELKNSIDKERFDAIDNSRKIVFVPHCLRPAKGCTGNVGKFGYECDGCEKTSTCKAFRIKHKAENLGYRSFIVPGGSMVLNISEELRPRAVFGIGCMKELMIAVDNLKIPGQAVELTKDGCVNTDVDIKRVFKML